MRLRTRIVLGVIVGVALPSSYALLARDVLHGPVDGTSLAVSVRREAGASDELAGGNAPCHRRGPSAWTCAAADLRNSGVARYRVRMREGSCWDGRLVLDPVARTGRSRMPRAISGCVHRWQW